MWASVAESYKLWQQEHGTSVRDIDSLKIKFDKLSRMKKPTGSADCSPSVRRAKHIARAFQAKYVSASLGIQDDEEDSESERTVDSTHGSQEANTAVRNDCVRTRANGRTPGQLDSSNALQTGL